MKVTRKVRLSKRLGSAHIFSNKAGGIADIVPKELELITTAYRFRKGALICTSAQMFNRIIYFRCDVLVNTFN